MLHGHTRGVKSGLESAIYAAAEREADVLLFGHTHELEDKYMPEGGTLKKPLRIFNPGSLGSSYDGRGHFGLIQIKGGQILTSHGKI
jgi:predicted phosphodiesterase